jgi:hypothetical protein
MTRTNRSPRRKPLVGPRHHSDIRELRIPMGSTANYPGAMNASDGEQDEGITAARLARVAAFMKSKCTKDQPESWHVKQSGVP